MLVKLVRPLFTKGNILKSYIILAWFKIFIISTLALYILISNANIVSELLRGIAPLNEILKHHILETPKWLQRILPVSCLIASLFSINQLKNKNELISIFASGFSGRSFYFTVIQISLLVGFIQYYIGGYLAPYASTLRPKWIDLKNTHFTNHTGTGIKFSLNQGKMWYKGKNYFFSFSNYNRKDKKFDFISLNYFNPSTYHLEKLVHADSAKFESSDKLLFYNVEIIDSLNNDLFPQKMKFSNIELPINEKTQDFEYLDSDLAKLNVHQVYIYMKTIKRLGINNKEFEVMYFSIFANSLNCILFALVPVEAIF
ncbi:MAG: LptF/LptG family permease [Bacteriovoracaceae bacterium]